MHSVTATLTCKAYSQWIGHLIRHLPVIAQMPFMSDASATFAPIRKKLMIMVLSKIELKELSVKAQAGGLTLIDLVPIFRPAD
jgi:hypothetical protein